MNELRQFHRQEFSDESVLEWAIDSADADTSKCATVAEESLKNKGWGEEAANKAALSFKELVDNACKHGNQFQAGKTVWIKVKIAADRFEGEIQDQGRDTQPFWENLSDPTADENLLKPSGRGIFIAKHFFDRVEFEKNENGVRVCFAKNAAADAESGKNQ